MKSPHVHHFVYLLAPEGAQAVFGTARQEA